MLVDDSFFCVVFGMMNYLLISTLFVNGHYCGDILWLVIEMLRPF